MLAWDLACQIQVIPTSNSKSLGILIIYDLRSTKYEVRNRPNSNPGTGGGLKSNILITYYLSPVPQQCKRAE